MSEDSEKQGEQGETDCEVTSIGAYGVCAFPCGVPREAIHVDRGLEFMTEFETASITLLPARRPCRNDPCPDNRVFTKVWPPS
jgi:hypothetical protein